MLSKSKVPDYEVICSASYFISSPGITIELVSSFYGISVQDLNWYWQNKLPELNLELYHKVFYRDTPIKQPGTCSVKISPFGVNGVA